MTSFKYIKNYLKAWYKKCRGYTVLVYGSSIVSIKGPGTGETIEELKSDGWVEV